MLWFGYKPFAPVCQTAWRVATPIGGTCIWCGDPIGPEDNGFMVGHCTGTGTEELPWHQECYLRMLVGGVHHQERRCTCFGGDLPSDPPEMTIHEAAQAAAALFQGLEGSSL